MAGVFPRLSPESCCGEEVEGSRAFPFPALGRPVVDDRRRGSAGFSLFVQVQKTREKKNAEKRKRRKGRWEGWRRQQKGNRGEELGLGIGLVERGRRDKGEGAGGSTWGELGCNPLPAPLFRTKLGERPGSVAWWPWWAGLLWVVGGPEEACLPQQCCFYFSFSLFFVKVKEKFDFGGVLHMQKIMK